MTTSSFETPQPSPRPSLDEGGRIIQHPPEPQSPFRLDEELHFDFPPVPLSASAYKTHFTHLPHDTSVRKMISVPEMRPGQSCNPNIHRQNSTGIALPRPRVGGSGEHGWERGGDQPLSKQVKRRMMEQDIATRETFDSLHGADRLAKQKSMERGILVGLPPPGKSPQGKRAASNGERRAGPGRRTPPIIGPPPPGLRMPLAFNSIARERGFSTGSHTPGPNELPPIQPHPRHPSTPRGPYPSSSAPDLYGINNSENRHYPHRRDPRSTPRSHPFSPPHAPYSNDTSAVSSANTSPHSSIGPLGAVDEMRGSFRSALFTDDLHRSSTPTSISERTEDSHAMTVDEAIGMYGSDTDEESIMREARDEEEYREEENRRSKGDSVLGGATSRHNSVSDGLSARGSHGESLMSGVSRQGSFENIERVRSKGDSVLGGEVSPRTRSRLSESEMVHHEGDSPRQSADFVEDEKMEVLCVDRQLDVEEQSRRSGTEEDRMVSEEEDAHSEPLATSEVLDTIPRSPEMSPAFKPQSLPEVPPPAIQMPSKNPTVAINQSPKDLRDRYGFRKQTQYVTLAEYEEWNARYEETLDRRRKKWEVLLRESGLSYGEGGPVRFPPKSNKVKRYIRKGIPPEWRGAAWFWYAGGQKVLSKNAGLYEELVNKGLDSPDSELIERDLHRTFPDNIKFKPDPPPGAKRLSKVQQQQLETPIVQQLRRVLVAFSRYVPKIGYCQSLNFLAGMLLLFMTEEKAFWMLWILTHQHLPGTHEVNLEGSSVDQWVLMMSVRESLPQIWSKIGGELDGSDFDPTSTKLPPITLCTSSWFMSGFIGSLPTESVLRVWDCLFYEGSKTLFRIALAVFKTGEPQIKAVSDPMEIFQVVQTIPRKIIDAGALIEGCYRRRNGFGHISQETIDLRRQDRRDTFAAERAAIAKGGVRASKDDASMRTGLGHVNNGLGAHGGHDIGRRFKKILVKV